MAVLAVSALMSFISVKAWGAPSWENHWENGGVWWWADEDESYPNEESVRLGASGTGIVAEFFQDSISLNKNTTVNANLNVTGDLNTTTLTNIANIVIAADNDNAQPGFENVTLRASGVDGLRVTSTTTTIFGNLNMDNGAISNATTINASSTVTGGSFTTAGTLNASGATTLGSTLGVTGATTLGGATQINNTLGVTGQSTLAATNITGTTNITGATNINTSGTASTAIGNTTGTANVFGSMVTLSGHNGTVVLFENYAAMGVSAGPTVEVTANAINVKTTDGSGLTVNQSAVGTAPAVTLTNAGGAAGLEISGDGQNISLLNSVGDGKGLTIGPSVTTLTGGTNSSTWTLADNYAALGVGTATDPEVEVFRATNDGTVTGVSIGSSVAGSSVSINTANAAGMTTTIGSTHASAGAVTTQAGNAGMVVSTTGAVINTANVAGLTTTIGSTHASAGSTTIQAGANSRVVTSTGSTELRGGANSASDGRVYLENNYAELNVTGGSSVVATNNTVSATTALGYGLNVNNNGSITLLGQTSGTSTAGLTINSSGTEVSLLNNVAGGHGLTIDETSTTLTGGTASTSLTLNNTGATFQNMITGGPARVTGVADGRSDFDAVNYRQLRKAYAGVASAMAMANIPAPAPGKNFSIGAGIGRYLDQTAVSIGAKAVAGSERNVTFSLSGGYADDTVSAGAGVSWSF